MRWYNVDGNWVLTPEEREQRERQAKEAAIEKAERLAERLRAMGINPDEI